MWKALLAVISDLAWFVGDLFSSHKQLLNVNDSLYPRFESNQKYNALSSETLKLRLLLSSYRNSSKLQKPLSAEEFILYRLKDLNQPVQDEGFFSGPGFFHERCKGKPGVRTSIIPQRYSVMEMFDADQQPKLLFVENIFGDESLEVESVGFHNKGEFQYNVFTKKEWQEWRPVFISFNS